MTSADPLAHERFRTIVSDTIHEARRAGWTGDEITDELSRMVGDEFPEAHFEYRTNEQGVRVRKVVVESREEVDPNVTPRPIGQPPRDGDLTRRSNGQLVEYGEGRWHEVAEPPRVI